MIVWGTPMDWKAPEIDFTCWGIDHQSWVYQQFTRKPWIGIGKRYQIHKYMGCRQERVGIELTKSWGFAQEFTI